MSFVVYLSYLSFFFSSRRRHTILQGDWSSYVFFFFSSRRRHTRLQGDWSSDVCSSDLVEARQLRHDDEGHPALECQRLEALQHQGQVLVLRRACHAPRRRDELEVIHHYEPELPQRIEPLGRRLEVSGRERQGGEGEVAQPHRGPADAGARLIVELRAPQ